MPGLQVHTIAWAETQKGTANTKESTQPRRILLIFFEGVELSSRGLLQLWDVDMVLIRQMGIYLKMLPVLYICQISRAEVNPHEFHSPLKYGLLLLERVWRCKRGNGAAATFEEALLRCRDIDRNHLATQHGEGDTAKRAKR